ncbi:hypothetical protein C6497_05385 [Candidatus Poribacteria bacterium]|nr:MAG: hypothetical protein C6497_05385 [Candidatus Poribacteria bacterium]
MKTLQLASNVMRITTAYFTREINSRDYVLTLISLISKFFNFNKQEMKILGDIMETAMMRSKEPESEKGCETIKETLENFNKENEPKT